MMGSEPFDDLHHPLSSDSDPLLSDASTSHPLSTIPSPPLSPSPPSPSSFSLFDPDDSPPPDPSPAVRSPLYPSITVGSPQKDLDPSSSSSPFISYLVTTASPGGGPPFAVRRRFRDFVSLADRLAESHRGLFIPARPDKSVVESQVMHKSEFVEQRRAAVEKYLRRLAEHPVIGRSEELRSFLTLQGRMPSDDGVNDAPREVVQPTRGGLDFMRRFKEFKQSVVNDWGGGRPLVVEEDREFLERKEKVRELEQQLSTASQQAEALVKSQQDMGETMGQLGLSLFKLSKFETEEAVYNTQKTRAVDIRLLGTSAVKASRLCRKSNEHTMKHLDTLHEYLGLMLAVNSAFQERSSALLTVQTLLADLSSLHAKAEKLEAASSKAFGIDKSRVRKLEELKETIKATDDSKCIAAREYERIKENNKNELDRLEIERQSDFLTMMKGFVTSQVGYAEKIAGVWEKVIEETTRYAKENE